MGKKKTADAEAPATPALLWNERGQIGCEIPGHAPHRGSDTWRFEHWKKIPAGTTKEDGSAYACELCALGEPAATNDVPAPVEEAPKKKARKAKAEVALATFCEHYLTHMAESGKSAGTCFSYRLELKTAIDALGAETQLGDITPEQVLLYFGSDRVQKKRNGKKKSPLSIAKTQRVLRLALVWAVAKKVLDRAPLPEDLATH